MTVERLMYRVSQQMASQVQGLTADGFTGTGSHSRWLHRYRFSQQMASQVQGLTAGGFTGTGSHSRWLHRYRVSQ